MPRRSRWVNLPTEAIHPESRDLDRRSSRSLLQLLAREDRLVVAAVQAEARGIERAAALMADALSSGGRAIFAGAGTSGRLGVLEAAECPPTFGTRPHRIIAIMAGGPRAVFRSKEGAEDREADAARMLSAVRVKPSDLLVGISASAVTPFVRRALQLARRRRARTVLVTCGPKEKGVADVVVRPRVGPEVLAGSTRMKAGTATKLVLNQITLLAMIRLKKVFGPYMVDLRPGSAKLRDRARRMVHSLAGVDRKTASELLKKTGYDVKAAVLMGSLGLTAREARRRLASENFDLRAVLKHAGGRGRGERRRARARP